MYLSVPHILLCDQQSYPHLGCSMKFSVWQDLVAREEAQADVVYNATECCVSAGLSEICLPLCSYDASMSQLKALAGICGNEFHKLIRCGAGGRNHISCCERRGVPLNCLPICTGVIGKSVTSSPASTCVPFIGNIVQCFEEGEILY